MKSGISRRGVLRVGKVVAGVILSDRALRRPALADADIDIGLVAPNSGPDPHTLVRVRDALELHQRDEETRQSIFPEFDGKTVSVFLADSRHEPQRAVRGVRDLVDQHSVQWIVSGDTRTSVTKPTEHVCKSVPIDCILACNRMKLEKSNPHPYVFQLLPDYPAWFSKVFEILGKLDTPNGHVVIMTGANGEPFFRGQAGEVLETQEKSERPILFADQALEADQLHQSVLGRTDNNDPVAVMMPADPNVAGVSAEAFPDATRFVDATFADPADLAEPLADLPGSGKTYLVALASRFDPPSAKQQQFIQAISDTYGYEPDPFSFYGGTAAQVIGRALEAGSILEVDIPAEEAVGGFAVKFDDQGRNTGATLSLFLVQDGTIEPVIR